MIRAAVDPFEADTEHLREFAGPMEDLHNWSRRGDSWVSRSASVFPTAKIGDESVVEQWAIVSENAVIGDAVRVCQAAVICRGIKIPDHASIPYGAKIERQDDIRVCWFSEIRKHLTFVRDAGDEERALRIGYRDQSWYAEEVPAEFKDIVAGALLWAAGGAA